MEKPKLVDSRVPRGKAAFHTLVPAAGFAAGVPWGPVVVGITGLLMAVSVVGGPRYSLFGRLFTQVIRPRFGLKSGDLEEAAPHRFAETLGAIFLLLAAASFPLNGTVWWVLTLMVVALAAVNWLAGICVGCQMYILIARLRGRARQPA